jgi:hypothetical protein
MTEAARELARVRKLAVPTVLMNIAERQVKFAPLKNATSDV